MRRGISFTLTIVIAGTVLLLGGIMLTGIGTEGLAQFQQATSQQHTDRDVREACLQLGNVINQQYCDRYVENCREPRPQRSDTNPRTAADQSCNWYKYANDEGGDIDILTETDNGREPLVVTSAGTFNCRTEGHIQPTCPITPTIDGTPATPSDGSDSGDGASGGGQNDVEESADTVTLPGAGGGDNPTTGSAEIPVYGEQGEPPEEGVQASKVQLYKQDDLGEPVLQVTEDVENLQNAPDDTNWAGQVKSLNIADGFNAVLYEKTGFDDSGHVMHVAGRSSSVSFNKDVAAVSLEPGCSVQLWQNTGKSGASLVCEATDTACTCETEDNSNIGECADLSTVGHGWFGNWADRAQSAAVKQGCTATMWSETEGDRDWLELYHTSSTLDMSEDTRSVDIREEQARPEDCGPGTEYDESVQQCVRTELPLKELKNIAAHRGGGALAPENTMIAFQKGIESGAEAAEIDVRNAKDGMVVFHDHGTIRTTGVHGKVFDMTVSELKELDADAAYKDIGADLSVPTVENAEYDCGNVGPVNTLCWSYCSKNTVDGIAQNACYNEKLSNGDVAGKQEIPTLEEALSFYESKNTVLIIELKGKNGLKKGERAEELYEALKSHGMLGQTIVMSLPTTCDAEQCHFPGLERIENAARQDNAHVYTAPVHLQGLYTGLTLEKLFDAAGQLGSEITVGEFRDVQGFTNFISRSKEQGYKPVIVSAGVHTGEVAIGDTLRKEPYLLFSDRPDMAVEVRGE